MKRVIFTTVQDNLEARKMLELALKSFYTFNSGFDFKVYCLDNSKEKFEEYFNKFNFENLEFINFKDGTKWNNYLEHLEKDELTDLERKNMYVSDPELYAFDTSVCISKLEIIDLLLEKYDVVIATDIDVVFGNSTERSLKVFLQSGFFLGACDEGSKGQMSFSAGFMYFNKDSKDRIFNLMDKALYSLTYEDLREIPKFTKTTSTGRKFQFNFFEQDLLDYFVKDYFRLNEQIMTTTMPFDLKKVYDVYHFAGAWSKPFYKFKPDCNKCFENNFHTPLRNFYSNLFKLFCVDIDFNNIPTKFTTDAVSINRLYNSRLQDIKKRLKKS